MNRYPNACPTTGSISPNETNHCFTTAIRVKKVTYNTFMIIIFGYAQLETRPSASLGSNVLSCKSWLTFKGVGVRLTSSQGVTTVLKLFS